MKLFFKVFCGVIACMVLLSGIQSFSGISYAANEQLTKAQGDLAAARTELENYKKDLSEKSSYSKLKNEYDELSSTVSKKEKELAGLLDNAVNKNPAYVDLTSKNNELNKINGELDKARIAAEGAAGVQKLKKEAAELRAKALAEENEARNLVKTSLDADDNVKKLRAKKAELAGVPAQLSKFKRDAMSDPKISSLQKSIAGSRAEVTTKQKELRDAGAAMEKDKKLGELRAQVKKLEQELRTAQAAQTGPLPAKIPAKKAK